MDEQWESGYEQGRESAMMSFEEDRRSPGEMLNQYGKPSGY